MEPFGLMQKEYFLIKEWQQKDRKLMAGFTTKNGGFSEDVYAGLNFGFHVGDLEKTVCENRRKLATKLHFPIETWVGAEQTHETFIQKVTALDKGKGSQSYSDSLKGTDGFFTFEKGILLTLCFADCVPLYFHSPKHQAIGVAHAGWKGTVGGIGEKMVDVFKEENIDLEDIFVVIGPSICEKCYIVDDRVVNLVKKRLEDVEKNPYNLIKENQYNLNLKEVNKQILLKSGIKEENIEVTKYCTSCHHELFYSHRRDQGRTGRMISFIGMKEDL